MCGVSRSCTYLLAAEHSQRLRANAKGITCSCRFAHLIAEGLSDACSFLALAEQARAAGKPVVVVKAGRSEAGRSVTFSHTASLAGRFRLFEAAVRARGVG